MNKEVEINYVDTEENKNYENIIEQVVKMCFEVEKMDKLGLYVSITLTCPSYIQKINNEYRKIDRATDVLSFPMFEKEEIDALVAKGENEIREVIGDIIISVDKVREQAEEYGHSFERELSYMVVHGFYHLMGYDHMNEEEKKLWELKKKMY